MQFSLSTRWNSFRHGDGERLIEEILGLGIDQVELGYDFTIDLLAGVKKMVEQKSVTVSSVHNYCPVPIGMPMGHPEMFTFADPDSRVRENAVWYTRKTIEFAAEMGAAVVVAHMGNVKMRSYSRRLMEMWADEEQFTDKYEKIKFKLLTKREKKAPRHLRHLYASLEKMIPVLEANKIKLGIEILPTWEAIPTEIELEKLLDHFQSPHLVYWHDIGHSQIRQNLGLINHVKWLERLAPRLAGMHIHDVAVPAADHLMPPQGEIDFTVFRPIAGFDVCRVFEPSRRIPPDELREGMRIVREAWADAPAPGPAADGGAAR